MSESHIQPVLYTRRFFLTHQTLWQSEISGSPVSLHLQVTVPTPAPVASAKPQVKADANEVLRYLEQHGGSADRKKVVSYLCLHGIDRNTAQELVTKLIQEGKIKEDSGKLVLIK